MHHSLSIPFVPSVTNARSSAASANSSNQSDNTRHGSEVVLQERHLKVNFELAHISSMDHMAPQMQIVFRDLVYKVQVGYLGKQA